MRHSHHDAPPTPSDGERTARIVTVPNAICLGRILGSGVLVWLACIGREQAFLWLFIALAMSDWVDGKLAVLLRQKSVPGPHLDSWADAALYIALLFGTLWIHGDTLLSELGWIIPAITTYALSTVAGIWKFRQWPSYHTRLAKACWFLILAGVICLFGGWSLWPLRVALAAVTLSNLETLLISALSPTCRADVGSLRRVLRRRRDESTGPHRETPPH